MPVHGLPRCPGTENQLISGFGRHCDNFRKTEFKEFMKGTNALDLGRGAHAQEIIDRKNILELAHRIV
jgi:hypothetical protein